MKYPLMTQAVVPKFAYTYPTNKKKDFQRHRMLHKKAKIGGSLCYLRMKISFVSINRKATDVSGKIRVIRRAKTSPTGWRKKYYD